jgi:uncharacterized protein involved in outer membrane biogenesis
VNRAIPVTLSVLLLLAACATIAAIGIPATDIILPALRQYDPGLASRIRVGNAKIRLLPSPALVASDVSIGGQYKPGRELVHIGRGVFALSLGSILSGEPRIKSINVRGAALYLYEEDAGPDGAKPSGARRDSRAAGPAAGIENIKIQDGSIVAVDRAGEKQALARDVQASIVLHSNKGEPRVNASGTVAGYGVEVKSAGQTGSQGNAEALPLRFLVRRKNSGAPVADASLTLTGDPAANLIFAPAIAGTIGNEAFKASATIDLNAGKPHVAANARFNTLKFEIPAGDAGQEEARLAEAASPAEGGLRDIISDGLFSLNLRLSADRLVLSEAGPEGPRIAFEPVNAQLSLAGKQLALELSNTGAYGGALSGKATLQKGEPLTVDLKLRDASLPSLLADMREAGAAKGTLDIAGRLEAREGQDLAGGLSGNLALTVQDGSIDAPAMIQIANTLYTLVSPESLLNREGQLPFSRIAGRANIERGILSADRISFEGPKLRATGHGQASLMERKLDFLFDPQVRIEGGSGNRPDAWQDTGVQVAITGSFSAPQASIDTDSLLSGLKEPDRRKSQNPDSLTQQAIRGAMDALRSFLNGNRE